MPSAHPRRYPKVNLTPSCHRCWCIKRYGSLYSAGRRASLIRCWRLRITGSVSGATRGSTAAARAGKAEATDGYQLFHARLSDLSPRRLAVHDRVCVLNHNLRGKKKNELLGLMYARVCLCVFVCLEEWPGVLFLCLTGRKPLPRWTRIVWWCKCALYTHETCHVNCRREKCPRSAFTPRYQIP